ncbi:MAG TPA: serine protease [Kofleriaceae bacterium]|nr:serine protease [Kofleriaceae bacterium]
MKLANALFALSLVPACISEPDTTTRNQAIVGGEIAMSADYPTVVGLETTPGQWFCTGTLIADKFVLTAAHCVDGSTDPINVRFDSSDISAGATGTLVPVAVVHEEPGFDWNAWDNDIAVLELMTPVTDRTPTPLFRDPVPFGTNVTDVGYGDADNMGGGAGVLRKVDVTTADCAGANDAGISNDNLVCMDAASGKGSCYGDSGGPTFMAGANGIVVAGVTSGGNGEQCGTGWDLYTSVHAEIDFIDKVLSGMDTPPMDPPDPGDGSGSGSGSGDGSGSGSDTGSGDDHGGMHDGGGCNAAGGSSSLLVLAFAGLLRRRRR